MSRLSLIRQRIHSLAGEEASSEAIFAEVDTNGQCHAPTSGDVMLYRI
ncbi:MAG: hypothetical protein KME40_10075 [Komarekiella atlantica HA4396-MV6]|nr:hypothetical protein [Komarekiella atlantica HA4396-MV6]